MNRCEFENAGFIKTKLSEPILSCLKSYIKNKKQKSNYRLAGNITSSYDLIDKDDFFFNKVLIPHIDLYTRSYKYAVPTLLTKNCKYNLHRFWVNFQKKHEFNPVHTHSGVFSFVIWIKIPSSYKKESKLPFARHALHSFPNTFQFFYRNILGDLISQNFNLEPEDEGTMLFFPSKLNHCVYPFYLSNKYRISISGNIFFNPLECYD